MKKGMCIVDAILITHLLTKSRVELCNFRGDHICRKAFFRNLIEGLMSVVRETCGWILI